MQTRRPSACRRRTLTALLGGLLATAGCAGAAPTTAPPLTAAGAPAGHRMKPLGVAAPADRPLMVLHYHRPDGDYAGWNLWAWSEGAEGRAVPLSGEDAFGRYAAVEMAPSATRGGFILRRGEWEEKDHGGDRFLALAAGRVSEAWLVSGNPAVYDDPSGISFMPALRAAFLDAPDRIRVALSQAIDPDDVPARAVTVLIDGTPVPVRAVEPVDAPRGRPAARFDVHLRRPISAAGLVRPATLALPGLDAVPVWPRDVLNDDAYTPRGAELGAAWSASSTTFRTWSPVASAVELLLYKERDDAEPAATVELSRAGRGLWEAQVAGDLHGRAYAYRFTVGGETRTAADAHGVGATADSRRSVVIDLARTDPEGFRDHTPPRLKQPTDEVIYEVHVRDFSAADDATPADRRGRYPGLTALHPAADGRPSTGLSHLKDLGVTAVHLLPIQDYSGERHGYNWGYWTTLFNVPESDYSTTPDDPAATIRELKQTIQTLHEHNIRVILDVVYNHTSITGEPTPFDAAAPFYYYRTDDDGGLLNDAGTGNSVADERPMVRKHILDSLRFWADEYKIDGFRFDLVGTHRPETVRAVVRELRELRPDITLYGEPWTGGGHTWFPKGAQRGTGFAVFNDHFRNALRGDLDGTQTGFATGDGGDVDAVKRGLAGAIDDFTNAPSEAVNYVSAHDNLTFWDKLLKAQPDVDDATRRKMQKLAHGLVLTAQGIAFIHGGADFARTKGGEHNSYNKGDAVNAFDWDRKAAYLDVHDYVRGLVALRRAHPVFRMTEAADVRQAVAFLDTDASVVAVTLDPRASRLAGPTLMVAANGGPDAVMLKLPAGAWGVVVNDQRSGTDVFDEARGRVELPPYSLWVAQEK